jgi:hypothetical protein
MYDWKRSKKIIEPLTGDPITQDQWDNTGIGTFSDVDDTSFNRYALQQNIYRYILEENYGLEISNMYLVVMHPTHDKYYKTKVPFLKNRVTLMLNAL